MNTKDSGIGIDPTNIPVIENLDVSPVTKNEKQMNNKSNKKDLKNKIIFTIVVIVLMLAVAFGVYYYLHLGQENKRNANFTLYFPEQVEGLELSNDINDYGDFSRVDITKCKMNLSGVDINTPGSYDFSVTCGKNTKTSKIYIKDFNNLRNNTQIVYKRAGASLSPEEFFVYPDNNATYEFIDKDKYKNYLGSTGIHSIGIKVVNNDVEQISYGVLLVTSEMVEQILICRKDNLPSDLFFFNVNGYKLSALREFEYTYLNILDLEKDIKIANKGVLSKEGNTGLMIFDYDGLKISTYSTLTNQMLNDDYGSSISSRLDEINTYYSNELSYNCEIVSN